MTEGQKEPTMRFYQRSVILSKLVLVAGLAVSSAFSNNAHAQNALGDGRGLEANPLVGSGGRNYQVPSFEREIQFRNAIATGNAPGGLSFRGDLGYEASGEFTGELGSDSLYSFRRDSLYSGLAGMGIRGTDAIQYQFAMTTGSRVTRNLMGNLSVSRLGGSSSSRLSGGIGDLGDPLSVSPVVEFEQASSRVSGTLRSTSSYSSTSGLVPELMSVFAKGIERERYGVVASPLMGLVSTPMSTGSTLLDSDVNAPLKTSYDDVIATVRARAEEIRTRNADPMDGADTGASGDGLDQDAMDQANNNWIAERLNKLQRQVLGMPEPAGEDEPVEVIVPDSSSSIPGRANPIDMRDPTNPRPDDDGVEGGLSDHALPDIGFDRGESLDAGTIFEIDPETLEIIRGDGRRVTYLVDPKAESRNLYSEHMTSGERLLADGRYFDAEERFTYALGIRQADVSAQLGRLHSQIGAGLVISGSVNLQLLMSEHLEVVSRRYSGGLLPSEQRLRELITNLRERTRLDARPSYVVVESRQVRIASGLLLAYLGYQIDDEQQMQDGFSVMRDLGSESDKRLALLLETVWGAVMAEPEESLESESTP